MDIKFNFKFSDAARKAYFIESGKESNLYAFVAYNSDAFSKSAREALLTLSPNLLSSSNPSFDLGVHDAIPTIEEVQVQVLEMAVKEAEKRKAQMEKLRADTIEQTAIVEQLEALSDDVLPESFESANIKSWQCVKSLHDRVAAIESKSAEIVKAREVAAKAAIKAERLRWIDQHGSDRLKRATTGGYNCQRLYIEERSALEYPEFYLDYSDNLSTKDRSCPSVNALNELDRYPDGRIRWVKERHDHDSEEYYDDEYNGEEAIVIEGYLGNYTLVKYLGDPQD